MRRMMVGIVMLFWVGGLAQADLLDDFEGYSTGKISDVASPPWYSTGSSTSGAAVIEADPVDGNLYGKAWYAGGARGMCRGLDALSIPDTNTASTLYLRVRTEGNTDGSFGLSDYTASSALSWGSFEVQMALISGTLRARNGGSVYDTGYAIAANTWYEVWAVVDQTTDTYDVYVSDGTEEPLIVAEGMAFRNGTTDALTTVLLHNNSSTPIQIDDLSVCDGIDPYLFSAPSSPNPENGATHVDVNTSTLTWMGGPNSDNLTLVDPNIVKYIVYTSEDNSKTDPNLYPQQEIAVPGTDRGASYVLSAPLDYDRTYYWQIEQVMDTGSGNAGDPNNIMGRVWSFTTVAEVPQVTGQPIDVKVGSGETAGFVVTFTSVSTVAVTWYKDGAILPVDADCTVVSHQTGSTLTIANVEATDEATYHCEITNDGGTVLSDAVQVYMKKKLAWYRFENNANDSAGTNHGTVINGMTYISGFVTTDGQAYAADPNGTQFVTIPRHTAYPRTGENNGLDEGTVACWVKCAPGEGGHIMTQYTGVPGTYKTAIQFNADAANNRFTFQLRDEEADQVIIQGPGIYDGEWHYVVGTISGTAARLYVDVEEVGTASNAELDNYVAWEYDLPIMGLAPRAPAGASFTGVLDDLVVTNYAMTQEEIAQAYYDVTGKSSCIYEYAFVYDVANAVTGLAVGDAGFEADCRVDLADFAVLAANWLEDGLYPNRK